MTDLAERVRIATGSREARQGDRVQSLWSGYGEIRRYLLSGAAMESVIVKHVSPPTAASHPRGWASDRSHARKLRSYEVEAAWYGEHALHCNDRCRVPRVFSIEQQSGTWTFVLEDLDSSGYGDRRDRVSLPEIEVCLDWLAAFHARFLGVDPEHLWPIGTYWHLETRPDELDAMDNAALFASASAIDARLNTARYRTFVHGDAKLANFCFASESHAVAAVDFQYVGGGCGMKDVAYLLSSCLSESELERDADSLLDAYFATLQQELGLSRSTVDGADLEAEWRGLYAFAWADFYRFLSGWAPGHYKVHGYSRRQTELALAELSR